MPYIPRAPVPARCAHCGIAFSSTHLRRKYCCNSCNVLAAQARKKAQPVAAPPGPTACPLPARYRAQVGPTRALGAPFLLDPPEVMNYVVGVDYWVQAHKSQAPVRWVAHKHRTRFDTREFYVSSTGHVWVRNYSMAMVPPTPRRGSTCRFSYATRVRTGRAPRMRSQWAV